MDAIKTGALIAEARKEKGLTQGGLAQRLHVSTQAVSKWERGLNFPDITLLEPLAEQLDLTVSELMAGERNAPAHEDVVRDSLRISLAQFRPKVRRWKWRFLFAALLLTLVGGLGGYFWIRDNTQWLPQRETVVTPVDVSQVDALVARVSDMHIIGLFDVSFADGITSEHLQMELWTHEGLIQTWELARSGGWLESRPQRDTVAIVYNYDFAQEDQPGLFRYGAALKAGTWNGKFDDIPLLEGGYVMAPLEKPTVVDPEHGVVLACFSLDPTRQGQYRAPGWLGDVTQPTVKQGEAFLLLRLRYE